MARDVEHGDREVADRKTFAIRPEPAEVRTVAAELGAGVENVAEHRLDVADMLADRYRAAEDIPKPGRRRQMVGMRMGLEQPVDRDAGFAHLCDDLFGRPGPIPPLGRIFVDHSFDSRAALPLRLVDVLSLCLFLCFQSFPPLRLSLSFPPP